MDLQLQDQHVLITGGSRGIGLACARQFLAEGARVTLVGRDSEHLQAARASLLEQHPGRDDAIRLCLLLGSAEGGQDHAGQDGGVTQTTMKPPHDNVGKADNAQRQGSLGHDFAGATGKIP